MRLGGWELLVVLLIVLLLFGTSRLPTLARSVGRSMKIFRSEVKGLTDDQPAASGGASGTARPADGHPQGSQPAAGEGDAPSDGRPTT